MKSVSLEQISQIIGPEAFALLEAAFRGCSLYIPTGKGRGKHYNDFAKVIGTDKTTALVMHCGGRRVYFKKHQTERLREKHARIAASFHGQPINDFAATNEISQITAYKILKNAGITFPLSRRGLSEEERARIATAYHGEAISEFACEMEISLWTARRILREAGKLPSLQEFREERRKRTLETYARIAAAYKGGNIRRFAERMGISCPLARRAIRTMKEEGRSITESGG
jgi:ribosomal protein S25